MDGNILGGNVGVIVNFAIGESDNSVTLVGNRVGSVIGTEDGATVGSNVGFVVEIMDGINVNENGASVGLLTG